MTLRTIAFPTPGMTRKKQNDFERKVLGRKYKSRIDVKGHLGGSAG